MITIKIKDSDFCTVCGKFIEKWFTKCNECRKVPVTFADLL